MVQCNPTTLIFWHVKNYAQIKFCCLDLKYIDRDSWEDYTVAYKDTTLELNALLLTVAQNGRRRHNRELNNENSDDELDLEE